MLAGMGMSWPASGIAVVLSALVGAGAGVVAQSKRDVSVTARKYVFTVADSTTAEIRVQQDDLVSVTFSAIDIAHSFTISDEHYRIDRRAEPGKPVSFRFRADKAGQFEIKCTLTIDERCLRDMHARLVVVGK